MCSTTGMCSMLMLYQANVLAKGDPKGDSKEDLKGDPKGDRKEIQKGSKIGPKGNPKEDPRAHHSKVQKRWLGIQNFGLVIYENKLVLRIHSNLEGKNTQ